MNAVNLYQIYDTVDQRVVGPIMTVRHEAAAIRYFTDLLRDEKTTIGQHPDDYKLILIGTQNEDTGIINGASEPLDALTGKAWRAMQERASTQPLAAD